MSNTLQRFLGLGYVVALLVGTRALAADLDQATQHSFKISIASKVDMDIQGKVQKLDADTDLYYTWKRAGLERVLGFDSMQVKVNADGKPLMDTFMSREKFTNTDQGKTDEVPFEKAPDALKNILQDSFGVPVCKLDVDDNGKEKKRTVVAGPGAKDLIDNGTIANAVLFHPPYFRNQDEWQADAEISMGNGGYAKGKLTYKKTPGGAIKVSGVLANDAYKQPGTPLTVKNARYVVSGEQTYDAAQQEWATGKFAINLSFQFVADDKAIGSAKGTMTIGFEKLPGKK
jgi:hypothetical protein